VLGHLSIESVSGRRRPDREATRESFVAFGEFWFLHVGVELFVLFHLAIPTTKDANPL